MSRVLFRRGEKRSSRPLELAMTGWWPSTGEGLESLVQQWLCSLEAKPADLGGVTIGKTIGNRVLVMFAETVMTDSNSQKRAVYALDALKQWEWLPPHNASSEEEKSDVADSWIALDECRSITEQAGRAALHRDEGALVQALLDHTRRALSTSPMGTSESQVWLLGQMTLHALQNFGQRTRAELDKTLRPLLIRKVKNGTAPTFSIAVHIRRGDACERWTSRAGDHSRAIEYESGGRPCYATRLYVKAVQKIQEHYNLTTVEVRVGTDSQYAAKNFITRLVSVIPNAHAVVIHYDRFEISGDSHNERPGPGSVPPLFIEVRNAQGVIDRRKALLSFIGEVLLLSESDAFVGTPSSVASKLIFLAIVGRLGSIPPFELLDAPFSCTISGDTNEDCRKDKKSWAEAAFLSNLSSPSAAVKTVYHRSMLHSTGPYGSAGAAGEFSNVLQRRKNLNKIRELPRNKMAQ